jgi:hypothetical protein
MVSEQELEDRRREMPSTRRQARGYAKVYVDSVLGLEFGCDFDFGKTIRRGVSKKRDLHEETGCILCRNVHSWGICLITRQTQYRGQGALLLAQEIPLPKVGGRIDHLTFDAKRKRMIGAPLATIRSKWWMHLQVATYEASQAPRRKPYQL